MSAHAHPGRRSSMRAGVVALLVLIALVFIPSFVVTGALIAMVVSLVRRSPTWWRWALLFGVALAVFAFDPSGVGSEVTFKS